MSTQNIKEEVSEQIWRLRQDNRNAKYLLINRLLYIEILKDIDMRDTFVTKYEQRKISRGDTFMGLAVCVSEQEQRLCKVV